MDSRNFNQLRQMGVFKVNPQNDKATGKTVQRRNARKLIVRQVWISKFITKGSNGRLRNQGQGTYSLAEHGKLKYAKNKSYAK